MPQIIKVSETPPTPLEGQINKPKPLHVQKFSSKALGSLIIPKEYRGPKEDGVVSFNINEYGIPIYDDKKYPPGGGENNPFYFWNHRTAPTILRDAGVKVFYEGWENKDYKKGDLLRSVRIEFYKPGDFTVGGQKITVKK